LAAGFTATARTFTTLKSFGFVLTNVTGFNPRSQLAQGADGTFYGTAERGEFSVRGTNNFWRVRSVP